MLYLTAAFGLILLIGGGTYFLIGQYLRNTTDLALKYKMAAEFQLLGIPMPAELESAEELWLQNNSRIVNSDESLISSANWNNPHEYSHEEYESYPFSESETGDYEDDGIQENEEEHHYEADLAAVFVIPYDVNYAPILPGNLAQPPIADNPEIFREATSSGWDLRTVESRREGRIRLLTYSTSIEVPAILQTGRLLSDQDLLLNQYLTAMVIFGITASILLAGGSWWLAGRTIKPAQKAWEKQQTFIANASHELRSPLTFIRASADYALHSKRQEDQTKMLSDILDESDYMDHLVDDLLLLSRLDAGKLHFETEDVDLRDLFTETVQKIEKSEKDVKIEIASTNLHVWTDRDRLRQILIIILDNAYRFTPASGKIIVKAEAFGKNNAIVVEDSGKGITSEHLAHIFERFYQVRDEETEDKRSNGLGLSIAKSLVEAQGGTVELHSIPNEGTTVRVNLPAAENKYESKKENSDFLMTT